MNTNTDIQSYKTGLVQFSDPCHAPTFPAMPPPPLQLAFIAFTAALHWHALPLIALLLTT